jgi:hypothetical protein
MSTKASPDIEIAPAGAGRPRGCSTKPPSEEHGWMMESRADQHAREHALEVARRDSPTALLPKRVDDEGEVDGDPDAAGAARP